ncbi:MAG: class I adenylate-forming enzyme family protein [Limisphaerales bacterium]
MKASAWFLRTDGSAVAPWPDLWSEACRRYGRRPAAIQCDGTLDYDSLDRLSEGVASSLKSRRDWRPGQAVALEAGSESFVVPLLGIWRAGGVAIPIPPAGTHAQETQVLGEPVRILTRPGLAVSDPGAGQAIYFTSGSTGKPRAVLRGWRQALFEAGRYAELLDLQPGMEATMLIAPWFGASTKHFLGCLLSGCLQRFSGEFPGDSDVLHATPAHLPSLARIPGRRTRYRWISLTGEPVHSEARAALGCLATPDGRIVNALGGTEFGVVLNQVAPAGRLPHDLVGQPPTGKTVLLVDDEGRPVSPGEPGRLVVQSEFVAEGYLDLQGEAIHAVLFRADSSAMPRLATGDLAVVEGDGIRLLGRANSWIKHQGRWLDATPLRQALNETPGVRSHYLHAGGTLPGIEVWLEMDRPDAGSLEALARQIQDKLAGTPLVPNVLHGLTRFPRNRHGKLDLLALRSGTEATSLESTTFTLKPAWSRWADALLEGHPGSPGATTPSPHLDSLGLENLAVELERRTGRTFAARHLIQTLFHESFPASFHGDWLRLGNPGSKVHLFWFGDPLLALRTALPDTVTLWQVEPESLVGPDLATSRVQIETLVERCLAALPGNPSGSRIWFGGFSLGAWMAHEAALQSGGRRLDTYGVILVDPPRLRMDPFRRVFRSVRSTGFRALGKILERTHRSDSRFARDLQPKLSKEARRGALLRYQPGPSATPTWLFHGDRHGQETVPQLQSLASHLTPIPLGTRSHVAPVRDPEIRDRWIRSVAGLLHTSEGESKRKDDPSEHLHHS